MIILDTNVISELMKEEPDLNVKRWVATQNRQDLAITVIAIAEITRGLARLPKGKRRQRLELFFAAFIREAFNGRALPFDERAAFLYGDLSLKREKAGLKIDPVDLMILSIAEDHKASIATRNIKDFKGCGVELMDPWKAGRD